MQRGGHHLFRKDIPVGARICGGGSLVIPCQECGQRIRRDNRATTYPDGLKASCGYVLIKGRSAQAGRTTCLANAVPKFWILSVI